MEIDGTTLGLVGTALGIAGTAVSAAVGWLVKMIADKDSTIAKLSQARVDDLKSHAAEAQETIKAVHEMMLLQQHQSGTRTPRSES